MKVSEVKVAVIFFVMLSSAFSQATHATRTAADGFRIELRTGSDRVRMKDDIDVTVLFRSDQEITIWNALGWGAPAGLFLKVFDSSGHEVPNTFAPFFHPLPPDLRGRDALISMGGTIFAGFDSRISASDLFPKPGKYTLRCSYGSPLPRNYFQGHTIWGKEDGLVESTQVPVLVDE
jgi:hypothetical protein